eukprot:scaffold10479_cov139-Skeletonema_marinoi.AAC.1
MGTQWEKSGLSLLQETPWERTSTYLYPHIYPLPTHGRAILSTGEVWLTLLQETPMGTYWETCSFLLAWEIGGKGLGHWWETHLIFPLISHRIRFSEIISKFSKNNMHHDDTSAGRWYFPSE